MSQHIKDMFDDILNDEFDPNNDLFSPVTYPLLSDKTRVLEKLTKLQELIDDQDTTRLFISFCIDKINQDYRLTLKCIDRLNDIYNQL
jgi:hypothetical protein